MTPTSPVSRAKPASLNKLDGLTTVDLAIGSAGQAKRDIDCVAVILSRYGHDEPVQDPGGALGSRDWGRGKSDERSSCVTPPRSAVWSKIRSNAECAIVGRVVWMLSGSPQPSWRPRGAVTIRCRCWPRTGSVTTSA